MSAQNPEIGENAAVSARELVEELRAVRLRTRAARRGYRFPLLAFGVLIAAASPLYATHEPPPGLSIRLPSAPVWVSGFGGGSLTPRNASPSTIAYFWLAVVVFGAAAVGAWYRRRALRAGVRSRVLPSIAAWAAVSALLIAAPLINLGVPRLTWYQSVTGHGTVALLVIGIGLCVLAGTERSRYLGVIALLYLATALYSTLAFPENTVYRLLSLAGVPDNQMPYTLAPMATVLFPAAVLLLGAAAAGLKRER
jgi:hypothetical protein